MTHIIRDQLRNGVRDVFSRVASDPGGKHPFPVGGRFAESLGYPNSMLDSLPESATEAFTGVSNVSICADIPVGSVVLDLGCGAGLDSLIAAGRTGPQGRVVGVDFSNAMLARARQAAAELGRDNVQFVEAAAENIPVEGKSIDVALVNGIFNLNPARADIFGELARVVRTGGVVYSAELTLRAPRPRQAKTGKNDWFT